MKNAILPSVSTHYDFGNINYDLQMFSDINPHNSSGFCMEPILNLDNDKQKRVEDYSLPFQPSSLVTYQQAFPDVIDNSSHQQSILLGKKILAPQLEVKDFLAIQKRRKRPTEDNDMLFARSSTWELLGDKRKKRNKVTSNDQEALLSGGMQEHKLLMPAKRSQKLSDKITALQKLVSPYGKTDTASVLQEASLYIKLIQEQIQNLFRMMSSPCDNVRGSQSQNYQQESGKRWLDLRSRGLCLAPISFTKTVALEDPIDKYSRY
ncbi:transcription factor bHLH110-like [Humulus lupulus]|uniref:transcription factor bHLH110-like n=1 Tax=Humulus lupulus TaxID=3486 RepID=UPI002B403484|nr:transcription factor bHLH110-like [Humulus lupulus]